MTLAELNAMPQETAERELRRCCGSARWAAALAARRPFADEKRLSKDAEEVWWSLDGADWLEAFSYHPRIGERVAGWAGDEQSKARGASKATLAKLSKRNREYERKFGHVFLIFASGRSAEEMLDELEQRLPNEPATELRIAATEQAKITRLRLEKMLSADSTSDSPRAR